MSNRHFAFLRGMNLGRRRIRNPELCAAFEDLGFRNVSAFLASGNVCFDADTTDTATLVETIETGLKTSLGYDVPTFIRTGDELRKIAEYTPFNNVSSDSPAGKLQVAMLEQSLDEDTRNAVMRFSIEDDLIAIYGKQLYWLPSNGISGSELDLAAIERIAGSMTIRTKRTIERLAAKHL